MRSFAIIPAAGQSRRMGQPKLLLPWRGATVVRAVIGAWRATAVDRIVVVVRRTDQALIDACRDAGAELLLPNVDPPDMKASVRHALDHLAETCSPAPEDVWLLAPADQPRLSTTVARRLLSEHNPAQPAILVPTFAGHRGHPVLFPWPFAAEVAQLSEQEGVNQLLTRCPVRLLPTDDPVIVDDLDTPEDYERLQQG